MTNLQKIATYSNNTPISGLKSASLDTLVQVGTKCPSDEEMRLIPCTHESDKIALKKRAKRKHLSAPLSLRLVDASKNNPDSNLKKSYFNTYHCCRTIAIRDDGSVRANYCKNRWCLVCNSIRTAQLINRYVPVLDQWEDKYFVTLTLPNCTALDLPGTLDFMQNTFGKIHAKLKKQFQRKKRDKIVGLRKLECTYNADRNDYHPHYHLSLIHI